MAILAACGAKLADNDYNTGLCITLDRREVMPIYAYKCEACGHQKDVLQKLSEPPLTQCPSCGANEFLKQLTAPRFQLKGSGWYVTDFRDGGGQKKTESTSATSTKSEADTPAPAAASDPKPVSSDTSATGGRASSSAAGA
jgi:putative FmdB family regulatory protein